MSGKLIVILSVCMLGIFTACKPDLSPKIAALEKELAGNFEPTKADALIALYRQAITQHPEDGKTNLEYLGKGARIAWDKKNDAVTAVQWLNEALAIGNQDKAQTAGLLARVYNAFQYRSAPTMQMQPKDVETMSTLLAKNTAWIDSALLRTERTMIDPASRRISDPQLGLQYIEMAEGYAALVQVSNPSKYLSLEKSAAKVATDMENHNKAIQLYDAISREDSENPFAPTALFMKAFIYENNLKDLPKAKATYEEFLEKYPDNEMAESARASLKMLGKSPEEILKLIEKEGGKKG